MITKEIIDMPKLEQLKARGYRAETIALILGVSYETVRTILGAFENKGLQTVEMEMKKLKKCA